MPETLFAGALEDAFERGGRTQHGRNEQPFRRCGDGAPPLTQRPARRRRALSVIVARRNERTRRRLPPRWRRAPRATGRQRWHIVCLTRQHRPVDQRGLAGASDVHVAQDGIVRGANGGKQPIDSGSAPGEIGKPATALEQLHFALEDVDGLFETSLHRLPPVLLHERVGIFAVGKGDHAHRRAPGQQLIARPEGGLESGLVGVVEDEDIFRVAHHERGLFGGERGA